MGRCSTIELRCFIKLRQPCVDAGHILRQTRTRCKCSWLDSSCDVSLLRTGAVDLLVQLLCDFDKTASVDLAEPLQLAQLTPKFEQSCDEIVELFPVQVILYLGCAVVSIMKELQAASGFRISLIVEGIDRLEISIEGEEES